MRATTLLLDPVQVAKLTPDYLLVQLWDIVSSKGYLARQHLIQADTCTPHVDLATAVAFVKDDFWGDVVWSAALFAHLLVGMFELPAHSEVAYFDVTRRIEQYIIEFEVAVDHHFFCVQVL